MSLKGEITGLTALRFWAATAVLLYHSRYFSEGGFMEIPIYATFGSGWMGVDVFFVLSGFVISYVYERDLQVKSFFLRRFARIYPMYFITTIAAFCVAEFLGRPAFAEYSNLDVLMNFIMAQGWYGGYTISVNFVAWSVSTEWGAYLLYPLLIYGVRFLPKSSVGVLAPVALYALSDWFGFSYLGGELGRCTLEFCSGMMLYQVWKEQGGFSYKARTLGIFSLVLMLLLPAWSGYFGMAISEPVYGTLAVAIVAWATTWKVEQKWLIFGGRCSYSIYLVHGVVYLLLRGLVEQGSLGREWSLWLFWTATIVFSCASFLWIEQPSRLAIVRWFAKSPQKLISELG